MRAAVVAGVLLSCRLAAADCAAPQGSMQTVRVEAVYLGTYRDLAGHAASFFYDQASGEVIGPLDHEAYASSHERAVRTPPRVSLGVIGALTARGWVVDPKHPGAMSGLFEGFAPGNYPAALHEIVRGLHDGLLLGLLAGAPSSVDDTATELLHAITVQASSPANRDELERATQGILYTAPGPRAHDWLHQLGPRGVELGLIADFIHGGPAALAQRGPDSGATRWIQELPALATAWRAHPGADLRDALDDAVLGHPAPILPPSASATPTLRDNPFGCGPDRTIVRGPFAGPGELTDGVLVAALRAKDPAFTDHMLAAFAGLAAGSGHVVFVRAVGGHQLAVIAGAGDAFMTVEVTPAQAAQLAPGTQVAFVAHGGPSAAAPALAPQLDPREMVSPFAGLATRLTIGAADPAALLTALRATARSGNLPYSGGPAIAALFALAGHLPHWELADARALLTTLPGNVYDQTFRWTQDWGALLGSAIRAADGVDLATEVDRALPAIIARFAYRRGAPPAALDAEPVRNFAIELAVQIAARQILAGDLAGADRVLNRAGGPLAAIAGGARLGPEATPDINHHLELLTMQALVAALRHQPPTALPLDSQREHAALLLRGLLRPYARAVRDPWFATLAGIGFPTLPPE